MRDEDLNSAFFHPLAFILLLFFYRAGGIRTRDLLNPIQAHYQAVLRPVTRPLFTARLPIAKQLFGIRSLVFHAEWQFVRAV